MNDKKYYYKVITGFNVSDYISIDETELKKAYYFFFSKKRGVLNGQIVDGNLIKSIKPNYHKYTGWNEWYEPKGGEDFQQIQRDCPKELEEVLTTYSDRVRQLMQDNNLEALKIPESYEEVKKNLIESSSGETQILIGMKNELVNKFNT